MNISEQGIALYFALKKVRTSAKFTFSSSMKFEMVSLCGVSDVLSFSSDP